MAKVSFFRAFFGSCRGTAIFEELKDQSWLRITFHLLLLAFLLAVVFDLITGARLNDAVRQQAARLSRDVGVIRFADGRIIPEQNPDRARRCDLLNGGVLFYLPVGKLPDLSPLEYSLHPYYLFWQPDRLTGATCFAPGQWRHTTFLPPGGKRKAAEVQVGSGVSPLTPRMMKKMSFHEDFPKEVKIDCGALAEELYLAALVHVPAMLHFVSILFLTIVEVLFFALIFRLTGGARKLSYLTFNQFLKTGFYAAFPPLAFATLFPALELPFLRFSTVFMLGTVFYWLHVINTLEKQHFNEGGNI